MPADHVVRNRASWEKDSESYQRSHGDQLSGGREWGSWSIPEDELRVLGDVEGRDVLELGCGAAQWSIALAEVGARPVGLDFSAAQLAHARELMDQAGVDFPLIEADAEDVPLPDASFDIVFADHGAFGFTDPSRTIPESARLLRAGGLLAFSVVTPVMDICWDPTSDRVTERLVRPYFEDLTFDSGDMVEFQLTYGEWIRLIRRSGLVIEDLVELRAPAGAGSSYDMVAPEWAHRWPAENIWVARKAGQPSARLG